MIFKSTAFLSLPTAFLLTLSLVQPSAAEKPKTFLEWCNSYKSNPNKGAQKTVKDLIELAGSRGAKDCQSANKVLSQLKSYSFNYYGNDGGLKNFYLKDIKPLASLTNLRHLDVINAVDLSDISLFTKLETLKIDIDLVTESSKVSDLSPLSGLTNLKGLEIGVDRSFEQIRRKSALTDISAVGNLRNLKFLAIRGTKTSDITAIGKLKSLKSMSLVGNNIQNVDSLKDLKQLEILELGNNQISDVQALSKLKKLKFLMMGENPIANKTCPLFENVCNWSNGNTRLGVNALFSRGINP